MANWLTRFLKTRDLKAAMNRNDTAQVEHYLSHGADILAKDREGRSVLEYALAQKNGRLAALAIDKGLDPNGKERYGTPYIAWVASGMDSHDPSCDTDLLALLLNKGARLDTIDHKNRTLLHLASHNFAATDFLLKRGLSLNSRDDDGETPLHSAVWHGNNSVIKLMIDRKANVNALDEQHHTPLYAVVSNDFEHSTKTATLLLEHGADPNISDLDGVTPLMMAAKWNSPELVKLLLSKNADPKAKDADEGTIFDYTEDSDILNLMFQPDSERFDLLEPTVIVQRELVNNIELRTIFDFTASGRITTISVTHDPKKMSLSSISTEAFSADREEEIMTAYDALVKQGGNAPRPRL